MTPRHIPIQLINEESYCVNYIVYLNADGEKEFVYLAVKKSNFLPFQKAVLAGSFDPDDFGIILESGKGEANPDLKERMRILYKCDPDKNDLQKKAAS